MVSTVGAMRSNAGELPPAPPPDPVDAARVEREVGPADGLGIAASASYSAFDAEGLAGMVPPNRSAMPCAGTVVATAAESPPVPTAPAAGVSPAPVSPSVYPSRACTHAKLQESSAAVRQASKKDISLESRACFAAAVDPSLTLASHSQLYCFCCSCCLWSCPFVLLLESDTELGDTIAVPLPGYRVGKQPSIPGPSRAIPAAPGGSMPAS